ncbi:MAG TPA: cytochrome P450 [Woeseiaceae bacterium]
MVLPRAAERRPPGPDAPVRLGIDPETLAVLEAARREHGEVVAFRTPGGRPAWFVNDPAEVRQLLVRRHGKYRKGPGFERVKMLLGNGLIVSDGAVWRRARTMIQPAFSRGNVHRLIGLMVERTLARRERWRAVAEAGGTLDVTQETSDFALELILRAIFGADYERRILTEGENPFAFLSRDPVRDLRVVLKMRELRSLMLEIVTARRASSPADEHYDFLSAYLAARDKAGNPFSDEELLDELANLIVAGYETSAGTLNWAWYLLAGHPDAQRAVAAEGRAQLAETGRIDEQRVAALTGTQAVLEETLRLYPPVWLFTRRVSEDDALAGFDIPAGADLYLSPYVLHRTETYWPDPERFDPARFAPAETGKGERAYFPFSLGPRRCLGEYFAFLEMKIHLGILTQEFAMSRTDAQFPVLDLGINLRSRFDILLKPELTRDP